MIYVIHDVIVAKWPWILFGVVLLFGKNEFGVLKQETMLNKHKK